MVLFPGILWIIMNYFLDYSLIFWISMLGMQLSIATMRLN